MGRRVAVRAPWLAVALLPLVLYAFGYHNLVLLSAAVIVEVVMFAGVWLARHPSPQQRLSSPLLGTPHHPVAPRRSRSRRS